MRFSYKNGNNGVQFVDNILPTLSKTIEFDLNSLKESDSIPVDEVAKLLDNLKHLINHLGDYLTGSNYNRSCPSLESVKDNYRLIF